MLLEEAEFDVRVGATAFLKRLAGFVFLMWLAYFVFQK